MMRREFLSLRPGSRRLALLAVVAAFMMFTMSQLMAAEQKKYPEGCTTITVGRLASVDGSVMTSHTCDGHDGRTWIDICPHKSFSKEALDTVYMKTDFMVKTGDTTGLVYSCTIPRQSESFGHIYSIYPCMNEKQLAIGESTFGGKEMMKSDLG